jgi:hypothetical protein
MLATLRVAAVKRGGDRARRVTLSAFYPLASSGALVPLVVRYAQAELPRAKLRAGI